MIYPQLLDGQQGKSTSTNASANKSKTSSVSEKKVKNGSKKKKAKPTKTDVNSNAQKSKKATSKDEKEDDDGPHFGEENEDDAARSDDDVDEAEDDDVAKSNDEESKSDDEAAKSDDDDAKSDDEAQGLDEIVVDNHADASDIKSTGKETREEAEIEAPKQVLILDRSDTYDGINEESCDKDDNIKLAEDEIHEKDITDELVNEDKTEKADAVEQMDDVDEGNVVDKEALIEEGVIEDCENIEEKYAGEELVDDSMDNSSINEGLGETEQEEPASEATTSIVGGEEDK